MHVYTYMYIYIYIHEYIQTHTQTPMFAPAYRELAVKHHPDKIHILVERQILNNNIQKL